MIRIDQLDLQLPASLHSRLDAILRHTGQALMSHEATLQGSIADLGRVEARISASRSDAFIGREIARAILAGASRAGGDHG